MSNETNPHEVITRALTWRNTGTDRVGESQSHDATAVLAALDKAGYVIVRTYWTEAAEASTIQLPNKARIPIDREHERVTDLMAALETSVKEARAARLRREEEKDSL